MHVQRLVSSRIASMDRIRPHYWYRGRSTRPDDIRFVVSCCRVQLQYIYVRGYVIV